MRVLLLVPSAPRTAQPLVQAPIGMLHAASKLRHMGVTVDFLDLRLAKHPHSELRKLAPTSNIVAVCSSDYELAQCYPSLDYAKQCIETLRALIQPPTRILCVGSHATVNPKLTLAYTGADVAIRGEFEWAIPEFVTEWRSSISETETWPAQGPRIASEAELASLEAPAFDIAMMDKYFSEGFEDGELRRVKSGLVLGNRGCPFGCDFCYLISGRKFRMRPVSSVIRDIAIMVKEHGLRHFFFLDYTFTLSKKWVHSLCVELVARSIDVSWLCQTRVDCLDVEVLSAMREAGCKGVWLGVESPVLEQRRYLGKGKFGSAELEDAISVIRSNGMSPLAFVMVGLPNETELTLRSLNEWLARTNVYYAVSTFRRRMGTPLGEDLQHSEVVKTLGWGYMDIKTPFLGESKLEVSKIKWFFDYHETNPMRVANVLRRNEALGNTARSYLGDS
ncbi:MAG: B12-binding domain-containing radical SAM protein [Xanthomonadales bacterium]|nr:B12-binding domain-containing radical SAM protein [Xanthomonadales bacterium]